MFQGARRAYSTPRIRVRQTQFALDWEIDPPTLKNVIDRTNADIHPVGKFPRVLRVTLLYDIQELPFQKNDFGITTAINLWKGKYGRHDVRLVKSFFDSTLLVQVNGFQENAYTYKLKKMEGITLMDEFDDEFDVGCTVLEFERM